MDVAPPHSEEAWSPPFDDAFEADTETYPYGTLSATSSHVPSMQATYHAAFELAELGPNDVLVDLGCGDGRVVIAAARRGCAFALGVDCADDQITLAYQNLEEARGTSTIAPHKVRFEVGDIFAFMDPVVLTKLVHDAVGEGCGGEQPLRRVVIFFYLIPRVMESPAMQRALTPLLAQHVRVVTACFHCTAWRRPDKRHSRMDVVLMTGPQQPEEG